MEGRAAQLSGSAGPVHVRAGVAGDVPVLREVERDAGERFRATAHAAVADHEPPPAVQLAAAAEHGHLWVAELDDVAVGYAWAFPVDDRCRPAAEGAAIAVHLEQVSVRSAASGRGVGAALVEAVVAEAASAGVDEVTLSSFRDVPWNGPWYERLGFVPVPDPDADPRWAEVRAHEAAAGLDLAARTIYRRAVSRPGPGSAR